MIKKLENNYYVGLDIGTNSVGWAVTNSNYKVLSFNKKLMWGVRQFEEGSTAADRRMHRTNRRRLRRRNNRLKILKEIFREEIEKTDPHFFTNLKDSALHTEDKTTGVKHSLFNGSDYIDDDYHKEYPTIYHLRKDLMFNPEPHDVRLVYLAIHHIMKYRGHFLFEGQLDSESNIDELLELINHSTRDLFDNEFFILDGKNKESIKSILKNGEMTLNDKQRKLKGYLNQEISSDTAKIFNQVLRLVVGAKVTDINNIFTDLEEAEKISVDFKSANIDDELSNLTMLAPEQMTLIERAKAVFDWGLLEEIRDGETYISVAKIKSYDQHAQDLKELKRIIKKGAPKEYHHFFHDEEKKNNYTAYVGNGYQKTATADEFYKEVKKVLKKVKGFEKEKQEILSKIDTQHYMPKQRTSSNSVIPHQLHLIELEKILDNAKKYLEFLNDEDQEFNITNAEKIIQLFTFRIPYYVGPLNAYHKNNEGNAWVSRKKQGTVYPWNFEEMIDVEKSAETFIKRMTNNCTYFFNEPVLPKNSLLYQKYQVLNEINNIRVNGERISVEIKKSIFEELFIKEYRNVTKKRIIEWLKNNNYIDFDEDVEISGIDNQVNSKLSTYHDMKRIFGEEMPSREILDEVISWITLFNDAKHLLENKIRNKYGEVITEDQIHQLKNRNYSGWGRLSKKLLEGIASKQFSSEPMSIIQAMHHTNLNLMELLSSQYDFSKQIQEINEVDMPETKTITYDLIDELPLSPAVKRPVWQTIKIMEEVVKVRGKAPNKIFIEMARGGGQKGQRTTSRKNRLIELYKNIKTEPELLGQLENEDEARLRSKKLYLYYTQLGRCMYSGNPISITELFDNNIYDLDHIYPRSITKDDSLDNMVLVRKDLNIKKSDRYPLSQDIQRRMFSTWRTLKDQGFISAKKYERLIRKDELTDDEKAGFIARQIVETRQSTKALTQILKQIYPNAEIVFVKSNLISDFRNIQSNIDEKTGEVRNSDFRHYIKVRSLNDLHHAKDAYLSIVVGNVYHTKFTTNPLNFIKNKQNVSYNLARMYDYKVERNGSVAWVPGKNGTIKRVNRMMKRHDILTTRMVIEGKGGLYDVTLMKKGKGQVERKAGRDIAKYGGYNKATVAYYAVIEHTKGKKRIRTLESIPLYVSQQIANNEELTTFLEEELSLISPKIIVNKLGINSLIEVDGVTARITGKSGHQYVLRNEIQPVFSEETITTLKKIENYQFNAELEPEAYFINSDELIEVYKELIKKAKSKYYKEKLANFIQHIEKGLDTFKKIDIENQILLITEVLKLFRVTRETANLKLIGGAGQAGVLSLGKNLSNRREVMLINQSPTGLFENRVDLIES